MNVKPVLTLEFDSMEDLKAFASSIASNAGVAAAIVPTPNAHLPLAEAPTPAAAPKATASRSRSAKPAAAPAPTEFPTQPVQAPPTSPFPPMNDVDAARAHHAQHSTPVAPPQPAAPAQPAPQVADANRERMLNDIRGAIKKLTESGFAESSITDTMLKAYTDIGMKWTNASLLADADLLKFYNAFGQRMIELQNAAPAQQAAPSLNSMV